jgi:hypothetical protein
MPTDQDLLHLTKRLMSARVYGASDVSLSPEKELKIANGRFLLLKFHKQRNSSVGFR